jgi:hypothetical protein
MDMTCKTPVQTTRIVKETSGSDTVERLVMPECYGCGRPSTRKSQHMQDFYICNTCDDAEMAEAYCHHAMTGE